jgi:hypothetical protein
VKKGKMHAPVAPMDSDKSISHIDLQEIDNAVNAKMTRLSNFIDNVVKNMYWPVGRLLENSRDCAGGYGIDLE